MIVRDFASLGNCNLSSVSVLMSHHRDQINHHQETKLLDGILTWFHLFVCFTYLLHHNWQTVYNYASLLFVFPICRVFFMIVSGFRIFVGTPSQSVIRYEVVCYCLPSSVSYYHSSSICHGMVSWLNIVSSQSELSSSIWKWKSGMNTHRCENCKQQPPILSK